MRFAYLTAVYPTYVRSFYGSHATLELESYDTQLAALDRHAFAWVGAWPRALSPLGYDVHEVLCNVAPLQRTWAWENDKSLFGRDELRRVALQQIKRIRPEVLLFDYHDAALLRAIRDEVSDLRLVLGWVGGTVPQGVAWNQYDLVLSCAPESVELLRARGIRCAQMHHGFNDATLAHLQEHRQWSDIAFFGQIVTERSFHGARERFLSDLIDAGVDIQIFTPSFDSTRKRGLVTAAKIGVWWTVRAMRSIQIPTQAIRRIPLIRQGLNWSARPGSTVSRTLTPHLRPAVYGLDLFQAISDSRVTLNIHADTSVRFASNMRLFETTGVAGCLVTDWKENLSELFEPDKEIVAYKSTDECLEKIRWLLDHPDAASAMGRAAQARTMRDHTYRRRAERLNELIVGALQGRAEAR